VYKAYHPALDRYVALKVLHPAFTLEPNFLTRFQREAQVVARLEHPNIVPIFDYAEHEGRPYLVMKYIEGETLKAQLSCGQLDYSEILRIINSVGNALSYAHNQGVLHRDIKPSNVLLAKDDRIYLADFGLARIAQAGESTISSDVMLGTPQYISPEQAMGKSDLDSGTDIYSFGVLLYELVVGRVPFSADTPYSIIHDHIYAPLPLPRNIKPEISEGVELVLLRALSKDPKDRFSDIPSMVEAWEYATGTIDLTRVTIPGSPDDLPVPTINSSHEDHPELIAEEAELDIASLDQQEQTNLVNINEITTSTQSGTRRIWPIVFGIIFLCCLCVIVSIIFSPRLRNMIKNLSTSRTSQSLVIQTITPSSPSLFSSQTTTYPINTFLVPLPTLVNPSLQRTLIAAQNWLNSEPENPLVYLELANVYLEAKMVSEAERLFRIGVTKAGTDPVFFIKAGDGFLEHQSWLMATRMYLQAINLTTDPATQELMNKLNQTLYLAASTPNFDGFLNREKLDMLQIEMIDLVSARHILYTGDVSRTQDMVNAIKASYPDFREVELLEAEIYIKNGDNQNARKILQNLARESTPALWVRQVSRYIIHNVIK